MSRTVGIFTWSNRQGASLRSSIASAVKDYARNRAWNVPEVMVAEDGRRLLEEGGQLGSLLKTVSRRRQGNPPLLRGLERQSLRATPWKQRASGNWRGRSHAGATGPA